MGTVTAIEIERALAHAQGCILLLTAQHNGRAAGIIATSAQLCGRDPPLVCVAAHKGHGVDVYMRDSQCFGLCCMPAGERLLLRRFSSIHLTRTLADPFDGFERMRMVTAAPILRRAVAALDCQVFRQIDLESDHELIIGRVVGVKVSAPTA